LKRAAFALAAAWLLAGCAATARQVAYTDDCNVQTKTMVLDIKALPLPGGCYGHHQVCLAYLLTAGAIGAATVVVSGSIVAVGNTFYWLERQGTCLFNSAGPSRSTEAVPATHPQP
jgi:hypothetical protein